jgi:hypothetical protein
VIRSFGSVMAAVGEAALCRIFAGQYTMTDLVAGRQPGRHAGDSVLGHFARRQPARAEKGALPLTGASARTVPAAAAQATGLKPSGARGRLGGRQAAGLPAPPPE